MFTGEEDVAGRAAGKKWKSAAWASPAGVMLMEKRGRLRLGEKQHRTGGRQRRRSSRPCAVDSGDRPRRAGVRLAKAEETAAHGGKEEKKESRRSRGLHAVG